MSTYNVRFTDRNVPRIEISEAEVNDTAVDVTLFGRISPEYGEALNEDLLNLLENFACPEDPATTGFENAFPDLTQTSNSQLVNPTVGQMWYNNSRKVMYFWRGDVWRPIPLREFVAANWGRIMDGEQLPKPVSPATGYVFDYSDCIWSVGPASMAGGTVSGFICATDDEANVTMKYRLGYTGNQISGLANYLIVGIRGNYQLGTRVTPIVEFTPTPTMTPTMTPTPTQSVTPTSGASPTPTATPTPTITSTATQTPTLTPTPTAEATPTV